MFVVFGREGRKFYIIIILLLLILSTLEYLFIHKPLCQPITNNPFVFVFGFVGVLRATTYHRPQRCCTAQRYSLNYATASSNNFVSLSKKRSKYSNMLYCTEYVISGKAVLEYKLITSTVCPELRRTSYIRRHKSTRDAPQSYQFELCNYCT